MRLHFDRITRVILFSAQGRKSSSHSSQSIIIGFYSLFKVIKYFLSKGGQFTIVCSHPIIFSRIRRVQSSLKDHLCGLHPFPFSPLKVIVKEIVDIPPWLSFPLLKVTRLCDASSKTLCSGTLPPPAHPHSGALVSGRAPTAMPLCSAVLCLFGVSSF